MGLRRMTIPQALQHVADNPELQTEELIALPVYELVARTLFEMANNVNTEDRRSMQRANLARKMIFDRLVGKRRPGSHPATKKQRPEVQFADLTGELGR